MPLNLREAASGVSFSVRVQPGAKREGIVGVYGDAVKIALSAPAVDGKANESLVRYLATLLRVPRFNVEILSGQLARSKVVRVLGLTAAEVEKRLMRIETA